MTLNCNGKLIDLSQPLVMGILNVTPDSFYDGGRHTTTEAVLSRAETLLREGAALLDIGGMSSRPGAETLSPALEKKRVLPSIRALAKAFPGVPLSIDTVHAEVARAAVGEGAAIVNDISAGRMDGAMYATVAELRVPYILMHMRGTPKDMQRRTDYEDVVMQVTDFLAAEIYALRQMGVRDIVVDAGFGFGKTVAQNYALLSRLRELEVLGCPVLAGLSRKSMIYKPLGITPGEALNGTTALHMAALQGGARILRVHDARPAAECIRLWALLSQT